MISTPPRPDDPGESGEREVGGSQSADEWTVEGLAGRGSIAPDEVDRASRTYWEAEADAYQAEHGAFLAGSSDRAVDFGHSVDRIDHSDRGSAGTRPSTDSGVGFVWGPEGLAEDDAALLGPIADLAGRRVLEVGCGAAQCSAWLAQRGVHAVGIDIAVNQLRHSPVGTDHLPGQPGSLPTLEGREGTGLPPEGARDGSRTTGAGAGPSGAAPGSLHVVAASATSLPFADATFDAAFSAYGAVQFVADLPRLLDEVRRVLRPGGRLVFSVTHPIRWAFPDDPGLAGLTATGSYFDRTPYVERDGSGEAVYAEFHRTIGDYGTALRCAGLTIEALVEPEWPDWNDATWGGWSPLRGKRLPGTLIIGCRADAAWSL